MTLDELSEVYRLKTRREKLHGRMEEMRANAAAPRSSQWDGMPHSPRGRSSSVEQSALKLAAMGEQLSELDIAIIQAQKKVYRFISSLPDSKARLIMALRFVDCLTWEEVAQGISSDTTDFEVKRYCYRRLSAQENENRA